jgi:hypothetical protein
MATSGRYAVARLGTTPTAGTDSPKGAPAKGLQEWAVNETVDELDASDGEGLATNTDGGMPGCEITLRVVQKLATGIPISYRAGTELQNLRLYYNRTGTFEEAWHFPWAVVTRVSNQVRVRGQRECTLTIRNKGVYAGPGDSSLGDSVPSPDL